MKEYPMLFDGRMVRALLAGTKTQTRRSINPQPMPDIGVKTFLPLTTVIRRGYSCGDCLWVKETFLPNASGTIYRADLDPLDAAGTGALYGGWKPSIFMPRRLSRITLQIDAIRVERLQDISEADALAEGVTIRPDAKIASGLLQGRPGTTPAQLEYFALWESLNGKGSWKQNPWVWVIQFHRLP